MKRMKVKTMLDKLPNDNNYRIVIGLKHTQRSYHLISKTGFLAFQGYFPTWQGEVVIYNLQGEVVRPKGENWEGATLQELFREQVTFSILVPPQKACMYDSLSIHPTQISSPSSMQNVN